MEKMEVTLLNIKQCYGEKKIDILKEYGIECAVTDFAILLGGGVYDNHCVREDKSLRGRTSWWYSSSSNSDGRIVVMRMRNNYIGFFMASTRFGGIRSALMFSNIDVIYHDRVRGESGLLEIEYGEYPQYVVDTNLEMILESKFIAEKIKKTGKTYTTDSRKLDEESVPFHAQKHEEFEYNGKRYIRTKYLNTYSYKLSNGKEYNMGDTVWLEVSPLKWLVDTNEKILLSKTCIASGIRFCNNGDFKSTEMYKFLNTYFINDIKVNDKIDDEIKNEKNNKIIKDEIELLIDEIEKYVIYDEHKHKIIEDLNILIDKYNQDVERVISSNNGLKLDNAESYKVNFILKLNNILSVLKQKYEMKYVCNQILKVLKNYENILVGEEISFNDELNFYFSAINEVLGFINNNELKLEFSNLIKNEINRIESFLSKKNNISLEYDSEESFKYYFRTKLQPLLIKLHINAINKDVMEDIRKIMLNDMLELSKENEKSMIEFYLKEIRNEVNVIKKLDSSDKYSDEIRKILNNDINKVENIDEILKQMTNILCELYKLEIIIKEELEKQNAVSTNIKKYKITRKLVR